MMEFTAEMIAGFLGGEIVGNKEAKVHTVSSIEEGKAGSLSYLTNPKYEAYIYTTGASVVLVNRTFEPAQPLSATLIKVDDAGACVLKLLEMYNAAKPRRSGISPLASVCAEAQVGEGCYIGDFAVIEADVKIGNGCQIYPQVYLGTGVSVGEGTILYPGVKVYEGCLIGRNCILHAGAVIGADGFGFMPNAAGGFDKIPQLGNVVIEDDVEIGANTCIDRAKTDSTVIRRGVKLDNLIQIGHNVHVGENTVSSAQTGIAGTSKVGSNCFLAGQVGIADHVNIGNNVKIGAGSIVLKDVPDNCTVVGNPGRVVVKKTPRPADGVDLDQVNLPDPMLDRMEALVKRLTALEACLRKHADKLDCRECFENEVESREGRCTGCTLQSCTGSDTETSSENSEGKKE